MKRNLLLSVLISFLILQPITGRAFVPQTPHLIHLVVQKIKEPVGLEVHQTKTIHQPDSSGRVETDPEEMGTVRERLIYRYPDQLRKEIISGPFSGLSVTSGSDFITVINDETVSRERAEADLYTDILLYRNIDGLQARLALNGVDVDTVTIQRYQDMICYVIGSPKEKNEPFAGLWIDKETFLPVRYVIKKNDRVVESLYSDWQKVSRTWYPMQVSIFSDNQPVSIMDVNKIELKLQFSPSLFDVRRIERRYPARPVPPVSG